MSVAPGSYFEPRELHADPYDHQERWLDPRQDDRYCGVLPLGEGVGDYVLVTYDSEEDARAAGAFITHERACGLCSTLQDLAIYAAYNDLTEPVRSCGLTAFGDYELSRLACIASIGFTAPCAQIWSYNTAHTRDVCGVTCLAELDNHFNTPDGNLNPCLYCDEVRSGPIFKAVAGRTRRSSGLPNAICRPVTEGDGVYRIKHYYPPRSP
jgi:hypothetical protein